jgi:hypothetical protein
MTDSSVIIYEGLAPTARGPSRFFRRSSSPVSQQAQPSKKYRFRPDRHTPAFMCTAHCERSGSSRGSPFRHELGSNPPSNWWNTGALRAGVAACAVVRPRASARFCRHPRFTGRTSSSDCAAWPRRRCSRSSHRLLFGLRDRRPQRHAGFAGTAGADAASDFHRRISLVSARRSTRPF